MTNLKSNTELKSVLKSRGITLKDIAKEFDVHYSTVTRYFNGELKMTADFLYNVAKYADIDLYEFYKRKKESVRKSPKKFRE